MADDINRLVFEIEQKGAARVERSFRNVEQGISSALSEYKNFSLEGKKSTRDFEKNVKGLQGSLSHLEAGIAKASKEYGGMFHEGKMKRQERRLQQIRKEMEGLTKVMHAGSEEQKKMARERMKTLKEAADAEAKSTAMVFQQHKKEFDRLVGMKKKSLGELGQEAAKGSATAIQQLLRGDVRGVADMAGRGLKGAGEQAQKAAFDRQMAGKKGAAGAAGGAQMTKLLKTFAKVAGPIAMIAGAIGMLVKLFLDLDARVKEMNKTMLENVSLVNLASDTYGSFENQLGGAELALQEFRDVMRDMDLRRMGLDPQEMGQIVGALNEQTNLLSEAREQGLSFKNALETAQIAALNLGVDATETAGLISTIADTMAVSFDEASESLTQIVAYSRQAGVSTQRFFNAVQGVVGEMGLYNYRIEETAALFARLSNIMDAENAEKFTQELSTQLKNMSAQERVQHTLLAGMDATVDALDRTQDRLLEGLDRDAIEEIAEQEGLGVFFEGREFEDAIAAMSQEQRNILQSMVTRADQRTGRQFSMYRNFLETARDDLVAVAERTADLGIGDQIAFQIASLENSLGGMNLEDISPLLAEQRGVSAENLRMMQDFQRNMSGDFARLQQAAEEDPDSFAEVAERLGYQVELSEIQNREIEDWQDLLRVMTDEKMDGLQDEAAKQRTAAERTADFQRTLLDTLKYTLLDYVESIYGVLLNVYDAILSILGRGGGRQAALDEARRRQRAMQERRELQEDISRAIERGDEDAVERLQKKEDELERRIAQHTPGTEEYEDRRSRERRGERAAQELVDAFRAREVSFFAEGGEQWHGLHGLDDEGILDMMRKGDIAHVQRGDGPLQDFQDVINRMDSDRRADMALRHDTIDLLHEGVETEEEMLERLGETVDRLERDTVLDRDTIEEMAKKNARHYVEQWQRATLISDIAEGEGVSHAEAERLVDLVQGQGSAWDVYSPGMRQARERAQEIVQPYQTRTARDARIVTSGFPLLDLSAGDIIVDQDALAQTMAGGKGTYVPELLSSAARRSGGGGGAGGGAGNVMYATFNISGDNYREIREYILKVIQEWERKRSYS